jgi:adenylate cyclase class 2
MGSVETEIKLRVKDAATAAALLQHAGFRVRHERTFEANTLLDTASGQLRAKRQILRFRQYGERHVLTYKGSPVDGRHKTREELEMVLAGEQPLRSIFERLGFLPLFRYEKYRTEYSREGEPGMAVLDETPIGTFLELEGTPEWIDRTARELGFEEADYILQSYGALYAEYAAAHGTNPAAMVFLAGEQPPHPEGVREQ